MVYNHFWQWWQILNFISVTVLQGLAAVVSLTTSSFHPAAVQPGCFSAAFWPPQLQITYSSFLYFSPCPCEFFKEVLLQSEWVVFSRHHAPCVIKVPEGGSEGDCGLWRAWSHQWIKSHTPRITLFLTCPSAGLISTASSLTVSIKAGSMKTFRALVLDLKPWYPNWQAFNLRKSS